MLLHETNARELGFYFGALFVNEIDAALNPSSQSELGSVRQRTETYANFFGVKESIRVLHGSDAVTILQSGFALYHQCAMQIRVKHGETAADYFRVAFLATFYVRGRNAGMPLPVTTQVQSQIRDAAQRICSSDRTERFLAEGSAEALFEYMNQLAYCKAANRMLQMVLQRRHLGRFLFLTPRRIKRTSQDQLRVVFRKRAIAYG